MCRWLAYTGEPLQPSQLILDTQHSLIAQSLDSPLGAETVNGDGFGFGWYPVKESRKRIPGLFHSTEPAWNDQNLRELTRPSSRLSSSVTSEPRPVHPSSRPTVTPSASRTGCSCTTADSPTSSR